jgi:hypothetical protein
MKRDDPVVEQVREARRRIAEQCGNDAHRLYEWAKQLEAQHRDRVVGYERLARPKK